VFSLTAEYALRAVAHLARETPGSCTTVQVSEATRVPKAYLSKVLQALNRAGIVRSQRGVGGGITLVKPVEDLTLLEVINAVEPINRIRACPLGLETHGLRLCSLHHRLDAALALVEQVLRQTTMADLLTESGREDVLCADPDQPT